MAESVKGTKRQHATGIARFTWLFMILGVLSIGALMVWLGKVSEPTQLAFVDVEEEDPETGELIPGAVQLTMLAFQQQERQLVGQRVQVTGMDVAASINRRLFWVNLPNNNPYLLQISDRLVETGFSMVRGDQISMAAGTVRPMSDAVVADWLAQGVLQNRDQGEEVLFAMTYMEIEQARLARR